MGPGNKAYAVRTDPRLVFKRTHQRRVDPTMEQFTASSSIEDIRNITLDEANTQFVLSASVFPPYLYKDILKLDDCTAETILLHVLKIIHQQRNQTNTNNQETDGNGNAANNNPVAEGNPNPEANSNNEGRGEDVAENATD